MIVMSAENTRVLLLVALCWCAVMASQQSFPIRKVAKRGYLVQNFYGFSKAHTFASKLKSIEVSVAAVKQTSKEGTKVLLSLLTSMKALDAKLTRIEKKLQHCVQGPCPDGWNNFMSSCYKAHSTAKSWDQARATCRRLGGDLVKITSDQENAFIHRLSREYAGVRRQMWIGLRWKKEDKQFHWAVDDTLPRFTKWAPQEPSHPGIENCAHMWTDTIGSRLPYSHWNDMYCVYANGFICERPPTQAGH